MIPFVFSGYVLPSIGNIPRNTSFSKPDSVFSLYSRLLSLLLSLTMLTAALPTSIWAEETEFAQATGAEAELPNEPEATAEPELPVESPEATSEPELPSEPTELPPETETPEGTAEPTPQVTEEPLPTAEPEAAYQAGMFVLVTENTRVFSDVDETADEADGELYDGSFVRTANVRVEEVRQDGIRRLSSRTQTAKRCARRCIIRPKRRSTRSPRMKRAA